MPKKKANDTKSLNTKDYRHEGASRKNIPPASIAAEGKVPYAAKVRYHYSPHLPPVLRFDPAGSPDTLPDLIAEAGRRPLTPDEQKLLAEALRKHEPWLEWAGKRESDSVSEGRGFFDVDPVALHIHERVSAQAILKLAARQDVQRDLFADPQQTYQEAVQFYRHDIDWTNRLILGDSLQVMSSLARREDLAGKVQMIYVDPPYGIRFGSNFQPEVGKRSVKDAESDLSREVEMVRAYRDTWQLGTHSYLAYLRARLLLSKELLADTGSLFVQMGQENLHRVHALLDEVFGGDNLCAVIFFLKTTGKGSGTLDSSGDYLLWYAKDAAQVKVNPVFAFRKQSTLDDAYTMIAQPDGMVRRLTAEEVMGEVKTPAGIRFMASSIYSDSGGSTTQYSYAKEGREFRPLPGYYWRTSLEGMTRLDKAERLVVSGEYLRYRMAAEDYPVVRVTNYWDDVRAGGFGDPKRYVVQTATDVIQRCVLLASDPGDLVLDPTCGSGTTAYVAEQWGRRWITIDTSRVAVAIARQRFMTAKYEYYDLREGSAGVSSGFMYKTVPHITLRSIAQNTNLDPIFAKHQAILDDRLKAANTALGKVKAEARATLHERLLQKQKAEGKRAITDADRRRWDLPISGQWEHWEVPFDTDPEWPEDLREAVTAFRNAWRAKMDEVDACIAANAEQEELVDQPAVVKGIVRVSGPFTVEAVQPPELSLGAGLGFGGEPQSLETGLAESTERDDRQVENARAYLRQMVSFLKKDGVRFPNNQQMQWTRLEPLFESGGSDVIHAEGRWVAPGEKDSDPEGGARVGVVFGPQYGPVTAAMVEEVIKPAGRRYDDLVIAGFSFDGPAQAVIENPSHPKLRLHMAHIRPDVNPAMTGLLKEQPGSQLFTVFGQPRIGVHGPGKRGAPKGEYVVEMEGVDIYDPVTNEIRSTKAEKVAAWFLDSDYDGRTFCITQAFFPDRSAWEKLAKALGGVVDPERFEAFSGTLSLPFPPGAHKRIAVKVIDPRGNEVMATRELES